jgi:hypothetical protein
MDAGGSYAQYFSSCWWQVCESFNQYIGPNPKDNQAFLDYPTGQILGTLFCALIMLYWLCRPRVPARKCSSISMRQLAMSPVCRTAMVLTDRNFVVCMHQLLIFFLLDWKLMSTVIPIL